MHADGATVGVEATAYEDSRAGDVLGGLSLLPSMLPPPPRGFRVRNDDEAEYTYPAHFEDDLSALDRARAEAWATIGDDIGIDPAARVVIRIARNPEEMRAMAPRGIPPPSYASGVAYPSLGLILLTLTTHDPNAPVPNTTQVLTHELSHVALHRAVAGLPLPPWFSEGMAVHHSGENGLERIRTLWEGKSQGRLMRLSKLSDGFADNSGRVDLAYAQAADVVAFMLREPRGREKMRRLLAEVREGRSFDAALEATFFYDLPDLERTWRRDLDVRHSRWPLVLGGGGLWAVALVAIGIGYLRRRRRNRQVLTRWGNEEAAMASLEAELRIKLARAERERAQERARLRSEAPLVTSPDPVDSVDPAVTPSHDHSAPDAGIPSIDSEGERHTLH